MWRFNVWRVIGITVGISNFSPLRLHSVGCEWRRKRFLHYFCFFQSWFAVHLIGSFISNVHFETNAWFKSSQDFVTAFSLEWRTLLSLKFVSMNLKDPGPLISLDRLLFHRLHAYQVLLPSWGMGCWDCLTQTFQTHCRLCWYQTKRYPFACVRSQLMLAGTHGLLLKIHTISGIRLCWASTWSYLDMNRNLDSWLTSVDI